MPISAPEVTNPLFIIGAGFNADASAETPLGQIKYPLIRDLLKECFGLSDLPKGMSIEQLFQTALDAEDHAPMDRLVKALTKADHFVPGRLPTDNIYTRFLRKFPSAPILSFNYDGLLEILALELRQWRPEDGFGVEVKADLIAVSKPELPHKSARQILHLHGTLYVYPLKPEIIANQLNRGDSWRSQETSQFVFDPDSATSSFVPFKRPAPGLFYQFPNERIIAPVPSKAEGLKKYFVQHVHNKTRNLMDQSSGSVVAIGYSFNSADSTSYAPLLERLASRQVLLVDPGAESLAQQLRSEYPLIEWEPMNCTFAQWAEAGFRTPPFS